MILKKNLNLINLSILSLITLPISLLGGSLIINLNIFFVIFFYLFFFFAEKERLNNNILLKVSLIFFITLILNIFFNTGDQFSYERQIGSLRFFLFIISISFFLQFKNSIYLNRIFKLWFFIFLFVTFDLYFEYIFGFNIIGNTSYLPSRLSGFLGDELKIGNFYYGFIFIIISYVLLNVKKNIFKYTLILIFLLCSLLIGERSNFIRVFCGFIIFFTLIDLIEIKKKLICFILAAIIILLGIKIDPNLKMRFYDQTTKKIFSQGINEYIKTSTYGAHYDTAFKIFNENKYFGVGLKQFRYESQKEKYKYNPYNLHNYQNWSTHPHQIYLEFLSETGLFGTFFFILFIFISCLIGFLKYLKNKNLYLLSSIVFILTTVIPFIPSGSFFTTYTATIFWINYAILISNLK